MTPESQRIAIAEACGWKGPFALGGVDYELRGTSPAGNPLKYLPDYTGDLNAMHEAEKVLTNSQRRQYVQFLIQVHPLRYDPFMGFEEDPEANDGYMKIFHLTYATAAQRAEAFLRATGRWVEP